MQIYGYVICIHNRGKITWLPIFISINEYASVGMFDIAYVHSSSKQFFVRAYKLLKVKSVHDV